MDIYGALLTTMLCRGKTGWKEKWKGWRNVSIRTYVIDDDAVGERSTSYCSFGGERTKDESTSRRFESSSTASTTFCTEEVCCRDQGVSLVKVRAASGYRTALTFLESTTCQPCDTVLRWRDPVLYVWVLEIVLLEVRSPEKRQYGAPRWLVAVSRKFQGKIQWASKTDIK